MSEFLLQIEGLTKAFNQLAAVDKLNLNLKHGEFVTLLGPSGCGKSTTLRMIGGFESPDSGHILVDGQDITALPPNKRNVNMVFQDYALFPHMSVSKNVGFGLELQGLGKAEIAAKVKELLALVRLENFADRMPHQLSGGQRQRVALARALAPNPPVLLLDEPLGALDAKLRREMQSELRRLQKATGKTFILVTHDQEEALTMSDTIIVMNGGKIEQQGSPTELYDNPKTEFVAKFIGEMNVLPVELISVGERETVVRWNSIELRGYATEYVALTPLIATVRPEAISLSAERPTGAVNAVEGKIVDRVFRGNEMRFVVDVDGTSFDVSTRDAAASALADDVWLSWPFAKTLILERAS